MVKLRILAEVPEGTGDVYLTGSLPELGPWKPDALTMEGTGAERAAELRVLPGTRVEFKITRGTWEREAATADGGMLPNNVAEVGNEETTVRIRVAAFRKTYDEVFAADAQRPPQAEERIAILWPRDWQVIQRDSTDRGRVLVSGRVRGGSGHVAIWARNAAGADVAKPVSVETDAALGAFQARLDVPAGGWYSLVVTASDAETSETLQAVVPRFGVGEVFVTAGQSNSTNCGQLRTQQTSGMVSSFSGTFWRLGNDPQPGAHDKSLTGSPWPAFGDELYARLGVPIGIAVTGHGGTSVGQWEPGGELYEWMMRRVYQLGPGGFRAVLWHQGESDWNMPSEEYFTRLRATILASRADAGWEIPWMTAHASYHSAANPAWPNVREAQQRLWDEKVSLQGPDTDTLTGDMRDFDGTGIHFSPAGLKAHGELWAKKVEAWLPPRPPMHTDCGPPWHIKE